MSMYLNPEMYIQEVLGITMEAQIQTQEYQSFGLFTPEKEAILDPLKDNLRQLGVLLNYDAMSMVEISSNPEEMRQFIEKYTEIFKEMQNFIQAESSRKIRFQHCIQHVTSGLNSIEKAVDSMQDHILNGSFIEAQRELIRECHQVLSTYDQEPMCVPGLLDKSRELWTLLDAKDSERQGFLQAIYLDLENIKGVMDTDSCSDIQVVLRRITGYQTVLEQQRPEEVEGLMGSIHELGQHLQARLNEFEELIGSIKTDLEPIYAIVASGDIRKSTATKHIQTLSQMAESLTAYSEQDISALIGEINQLHAAIQANTINIVKSGRDDDSSDDDTSAKRLKPDLL